VNYANSAVENTTIQVKETSNFMPGDGRERSLKKCYSYFQPYKKAVILAPLLVVVDVMCEIFQPELMSRIVDIGVRQKDLAYIFNTGGIT
jgi:hypothetical protein